MHMRSAHASGLNSLDRRQARAAVKSAAVAKIKAAESDGFVVGADTVAAGTGVSSSDATADAPPPPPPEWDAPPPPPPQSAAPPPPPPGVAHHWLPPPGVLMTPVGSDADLLPFAKKKRVEWIAFLQATGLAGIGNDPNRHTVKTLRDFMASQQHLAAQQFVAVAPPPPPPEAVIPASA